MNYVFKTNSIWSGKGDPRITHSCSFQLESLIPKFCHRYAEYRFFPISHSCPNFGESRFPGSSQVPHPVRVFRIPHGYGKYPSRP